MSILQPAWTNAEGADLATTLFAETFGSAPAGVWASPGRVNLIGEHTDYNGGLCLPIALPHRTFAALSPRSDDVVRVVSDLAPQAVWEGTLDDVRPGGDLPGWVTYAAGPAWALRDAGLTVNGFDAAFASCVPLGSGLSSSAAIECAAALGLDEVYDLGLATDDAGRARLAALCVRSENLVSGAPTGGLDQAASLRTSAGQALLLDCRDGHTEPVPFDLAAEGLALLVVDTKAPHALVDGQYAARRASCEAAAATLGIPTLREITDLDTALAQLDDAVARQRVRHVVTEIARVEEFVALVRAGRLRDVGPLMIASHESLRVDYEVTVPELDTVVSASMTAGALGARMTGGGFGGSAIALIEASQVEATVQAVRDAFAERGFGAPAFLVAVASDAGRRVA